MSLDALRAYLDQEPAGEIRDAKKLSGLLAGAWDSLRGGDETNMSSDKLWRIEAPTWKPPVLEIGIERHGQTVHGSSRATFYTWQVDLAAGTASIVREKRRQVVSSDARLDVRPIAESLANAIRLGKADSRLKTAADGSVRLKIGDIIPATNKQTTAARRTRLRNALGELLAPHGWVERAANCYVLRRE